MDILELLQINNNKINLYKSQIESSGTDNSTLTELQAELEIHKKIKSLLEKNPAIFFQIQMEDSLKILNKLFPTNQLKNVYTDLISPDEFGKLRKNFKI